MRNRDIIKQYVNTGKKLPENQLKKLNNSFKNSYFRKRSLPAANIADEIDYYELKYADNKTFVTYILDKANKM